ncbi:MAG: hypothetical protein M1168_01080 [Candidatus Marsarchaeota archaeon]|nr:hypothetical protein [Candidatus Marsarchaeota archaeon]MCL5094559.1 hypothetical protein [Candidatus Marsarchaeota archaeon]
MTKIYKLNNKLIIYLPNEIANALNLKAGDEINFLKNNGDSFIFEKKNADSNKKAVINKNNISDEERIKNSNLTDNELIVLRKLNDLQFNKRTKQSVSSVLNSQEKQVLQKLINKNFVLLIKKNEDYIYSISKYIYPKLRQNFNHITALESEDKAREAKKSINNADINKINYNKKTNSENTINIKNIINNETSSNVTDKFKNYQNIIETTGYLVIVDENDAAIFSNLMEESIRHGIIIGVRAFNKKFYIALKLFVIRNSPKILGILGSKKMNVAEIANQLNMEEDAIRTVLYLLAESGDVYEVKQDVFKVVI